MTKLLLIDNQAGRARQVGKRLGLWGLECVVAESFLYALTMLEWQRPDLVLVRPESIDGMKPSEFCSTIKQDPGLRKIPLVLLTEAAATETTTPNRFDLVLEDLDERMLGSHVARFLRRLDRAAELAGETLEETAISDQASLEVGLSGFVELVRQLTEDLRSGRLAIRSASHPDQVFVVFDHGQVVHAVFGGLEGPPAFRRLLDTFGGSEKLCCHFEHEPRWRVGSYPRSIQRADRQNLMEQASRPDVSETQVLKFRLPHH